MDKGYYDYDYQELPKKEDPKEIVTVEATAKSNEEVKNALAAFGWGKQAKTEGALDAKALQELVIKDINERAKAQNRKG